MSNQDVLDYFQIQDQQGAIQRYSGNPDYALGDKYKQVTLESLGINKQLVKNELLGMDNDLVDPVTGKEYPDSFYDQIIERSVSRAEKIFDVAILPRLQVDRLDYHRNDFNAFAFLQASYRPILHVEDVLMYYNNQDIMHVPNEWLKVTNRSGQLQVSPSVLMQGLNTTINPTIYPILNTPYGMTPSPYEQAEYAPQMLGITYVAGMMPPEGKHGVYRDYEMQPDMVAYIAKLAAVEVLERYGRSIISPGIASYSVSIDGISTSEDTTQSSTMAGTSAEIKNLMEDMSPIEQALKQFYGSPEVGWIDQIF